MFKHHSAAVNRFTVTTMTKIVVEGREFAATAALLGVEMLFFVVDVDNSLATVAPENE